MSWHDPQRDALNEPGLPGFDPQYFAAVWNGATDAHDATRQLSLLYRAKPAEIWECAERLLEAGVIRQQPVLFKGTELSETAILDFCQLWIRSVDASAVARQLQLSLDDVQHLFAHLVALGLDLRPKHDAKLEGRKVRRRASSLAQVNALLDGDLRIQQIQLRQRKIKRDLAALLTLQQQAKQLLTKEQTVHNIEAALDGPVQGMIALIQGLLREFGVAE